MNTKKKLSMSEITRQVLNQSIDLLHKLSNKKISKESAKKELSIILSNHYLMNDQSLDETKKIRLEMTLDQANEIIDRVESGKIPLYEAIMLVNRVIVSLGIDESRTPPKIPEPFRRIESIPEIKEEIAEEKQEEFLSQAFDLSGDQAELNMRGSSQEANLEVVEKVKQEKIEAPAVVKPEVSVENLMGQVVFHKKKLEEAVAILNAALGEIGYSLTPTK